MKQHSNRWRVNSKNFLESAVLDLNDRTSGDHSKKFYAEDLSLE